MSKYPISNEDRERIEKSFTYHPPVEGQAPRYMEIRALGRALAENIIESCPRSRERALALTKVEEAVMWANAAIARNE